MDRPDRVDLQRFVDDVQAGRFKIELANDIGAHTVCATVTCGPQVFSYGETDRPYMPRAAAEAKAVLGALRYAADALHKAVVGSIVESGATR